MNTLANINHFFRYRHCQIGGYKGFKKTGLYEHHANIFGHLIYTEDTSLNYIGVSKSGEIFDETYYPFENIAKVGTIIPKHLYELDHINYNTTPHIVWKSVAEKGYGVIEKIELPETLKESCLNEGFIPHGYREELNLPRSIHHSYFDPLKDASPENTVTREYLQECTAYLIKNIPKGQSLINMIDLHTADIKKYVYDPNDLDSVKGAYSFHTDYFPRCLFMFFTYISKSFNIKGRELLVGKRDDFLDFGVETLDLSPGSQPLIEHPFSRLPDERVASWDKIPIKNNKIILMNTLNPMFVHRVEKLKSDSEVIFLASYLWCKYREYTD